MIKTSSKSIIAMVLVVASVAFTQVHCGEKSESASIDFKPEANPISVNADLTIPTGDEEVTIKAPWYLFRYQIKNGSDDQTLYLVTFKFMVTGTKNGISKTKTYSIDPGKYCADSYFRPFLGIIPPGINFTGNEIDGSTDPFSRCAQPPADPVITTTGEFEAWYIDDLPPSDSSVYTVQIQGEGWFENASGEITERAYIYGFQVTR